MSVELPPTPLLEPTDLEKSDSSLVRSQPLIPQLRWLEALKDTSIMLLATRFQARLMAKSYTDEELDKLFFGFERALFATINASVMRNLNWEVTHNTDLPEANDGDRYVYIGNHPTLTAGWPFIHFMCQRYGYNSVAVVKDDFIKEKWLRIMLGDLMRDARKAIFINRDNREEAVSEIEANALKLLTPGTAATIFPDSRRPYDDRIKEEQGVWHGKFPELDVASWITETCFPRNTGLWTLTQAIESLEDVRFLDCTIVEPNPVHTWGGRLHIEVHEMDRSELLGSPESLDHLNKKLIKMWKAKNEMIRRIRGGR